MKVNLIADQALGEGGARTGDGLGFEAYSNVLAQIAQETPGPFTIGIFGEWGTGKTSLMRLVQGRLSQDENVITVWFNAWKYEKEEHPIVPLVGTIIDTIESQHHFLARTGEVGKSFIRALRAIAYGFSAKSKVKVPGFAEVEASFVAKDMVDRNNGLRGDPLLDRSLYYGAFGNLDSIRLDNKLKIVVIIDDLDRCFPDQAIRLLESIKLVLAQPGFIFVIGVARKVIEGYLQHRYETEYGIEQFKGSLYLDKIVQLPFNIPSSTRRMGELSQLLLQGQPPSVQARLSPILPAVGEAFAGNPRAVVRFINNILIDSAIYSALLAGVSTEPDIPIHYFAISRCLEHRWPDIFGLLNSRPELCEKIAGWEGLDMVETAATATGKDADIATELVASRELATLLFSVPGLNWLKNEEERIASIEFLTEQERFTEESKALPTEWDVCLSYVQGDQDIPTRLARLLAEKGRQVFFSRHDPVHASTQPSVDSVAMASRVFCIFVSSGTSKAESQRRELQAAIDSRRQIVAVILPGSTGDDLPAALATTNTQFIDLTSGIDGVDRLERVVSSMLSRMPRSADR